MTTVHGRKPTPRVLVDITDDELTHGIEAMFETVHRLADPAELNDLRQAEWDVLITDRNTLDDFSMKKRQQWWVESHLFVLLLGWGPNGSLGVPASLEAPEPLPDARAATLESLQRAATHVTVTAVPTVAEELQVPELDDPALEDLVEQTLLPLLKECDRKYGLAFKLPVRSGPSAQRPDHFSAFLETTEPVALAGRLKRDREKAAECWVLPDGVRQPLEWVRVAVRRWQTIAPERFERLPG